jgi:hypothetical protein
VISNGIDSVLFGSDLARHFKTEPSETVAFCFGIPKIPCLPEPIDTVSTD